LWIATAPNRQEDALTSRTRFWLAAALGIALGQARPGLAADPPAGEPARILVTPSAVLPPVVSSANQQLADTIADQVRHSGQLRHYTIDVTVRDGCVTVSGAVTGQAQREEVLRLIQGVPGVERVIDQLSVSGSSGSVTPARGPADPPGRLPEPLPGNATPPPVRTDRAGSGNGNGNGSPSTEPLPLYKAPAPSPYALNPPMMPPYAWPTYAPYNNYSRVAYPLAYPYKSWPFIGPIYPFPKIPLGWRSVRLQWDDGYWWFGRTATKHDWWKLRYW
jgi:hypothetical protein